MINNFVTTEHTMTDWVKFSGQKILFSALPQNLGSHKLYMITKCKWLHQDHL
jgi:hypothetical protein